MTSGRAPLPPDEPQRLAALRAAGILDTAAEPEFDDVARLAAHICGTPIALVSLVDADRQWFKARVGLKVAETPRDVAFCAHAILGRDLFVVADAARDPRFAGNPLVTGDPRVRFYAGAPLVSGDGHGLGTLCVIDHVPRVLSDSQAEALRILAGRVIVEIELRRRMGELQAALEATRRAEQTLRQVSVRMPVPRAPRRSGPPTAVAALALLLGLGLTLWGARASLSKVEAERQTRLDRAVARIGVAVEERIASYEEVLRGAHAFVRARGPGLQAGEWRAYVSGLGLAGRHPGIRGLGWIEPVPASQLPLFVASRRREDPGFEVRPAGTHAERFVIKYIEPFESNRPALGYDVGSEPVRRAAAERARDLGVPALTGRIALVQDASHRAGLLMFVPVYQDGAATGTTADRRRALLGWTYAALRLDDVMSGLSALALPEVDFDVFDGDAATAEHLLADADGTPRLGQAPAGAFQRDVTVPVHGRAWLMRFTALGGLDLVGNTREPALVLLGGLLVSGLFAGIAWSLASTRARALALAQEMTAALRASEAHTLAVMDGVVDAIVTFDEGGAILSVNRAAEQVFGQPPSALIGRSIESIIPLSHGDLHDGFRNESVGRRADGTRFPLDLAISEARASGRNVFVAVARDVSERKRAEAALRESEARYRDLFENANDLVQSVDGEGRLLYVNRAWREALGYEADDLPRLRIFDIVDPESQSHCAEMFQRVLRGEKVDRVDAVFRTRSGRRIVVEGTVNARFEEGSPASTRAIFRDVTERREAEAALRASQQAAAESQARLQAVLDAATEVSIIATDPAGTITVFNAGAERMLGYTSEEMVGQQTPAVLHLPEEVEARAAELSAEVGRPLRGFDVFVERARQEGHEEREWTYVHRDGSRLLVSMAVTAVRDAAGQITGFLGVAKDITQRRRAEEALRESERRLAQFMEAVPVGIFVIDSAGHPVFANQVAQRILGRGIVSTAGAEALPEVYQVYVAGTGELYPTERLPILRALAGQACRVEDMEVRRADQVVPLEVLATPVYDAHGRVAFAIAVFQDISERREVDRLKKEFVSTVSHELRTPLTSIRGSLTLLAGGALGELPEDAAEVVAIAERNCLRLVALINDILDLERLDTGGLEMHLAPVSAATVVERALESVRGVAVEGGVLVEPEAVAGELRGDVDRLVQVLVNLLGNAVKFSPRGSVVKVTAQPLATGVLFAVRDQGRGIPASHRSAIFERFRQVEASDARQKGGTGLGLAICKAIVEQHGGEIGVESELGRGSTFWFRIPAGEERP